MSGPVFDGAVPVHRQAGPCVPAVSGHRGGRRPVRRLDDVGERDRHRDGVAAAVAVVGLQRYGIIARLGLAVVGDAGLRRELPGRRGRSRTMPRLCPPGCRSAGRCPHPSPPAAPCRCSCSPPCSRAPLRVAVVARRIPAAALAVIALVTGVAATARSCRWRRRLEDGVGGERHGEVHGTVAVYEGASSGSSSTVVPATTFAALVAAMLPPPMAWMVDTWF